MTKRKFAGIVAAAVLSAPLLANAVPALAAESNRASEAPALTTRTGFSCSEASVGSI